MIYIYFIAYFSIKICQVISILVLKSSYFGKYWKRYDIYKFADFFFFLTFLASLQWIFARLRRVCSNLRQVFVRNINFWVICEDLNFKIFFFCLLRSIPLMCLAFYSVTSIGTIACSMVAKKKKAISTWQRQLQQGQR